MSWVDGPGIVLPHLTLQTVIGISVAVTGNVLISLALNLQKLAHLRLSHGRQNGITGVEREGRPTRRDTINGVGHPDNAARFGATQQALGENHQSETQPLIPRRSSSQPPPSSYDLAQYHNRDDVSSRKSCNGPRSRRRPRKQPFVSRFLPLPSVLGEYSHSSNGRVDLSPSAVFPVEDTLPQQNARSNRRGKGKGTSQDTIENDKESNYLHSKLWFVSRAPFNISSNSFT